MYFIFVYVQLTWLPQVPSALPMSECVMPPCLFVTDTDHASAELMLSGNATDVAHI